VLRYSEVSLRFPRPSCMALTHGDGCMKEGRYMSGPGPGSPGARRWEHCGGEVVAANERVPK